MLEALRIAAPRARYFQAGSSEMFGSTNKALQNEQTPFHPTSPYATAKVFAHCLTVNYRQSFGLFTCNGIMFNHDSPLRGSDFVMRKITDGAVRIIFGFAQELPKGMTCPPEMLPIFGRACFSRGRTNETQQVQR